MTTAPGTHDFTIYQGATFSRVITWKDENEDEVDLTGYTARMQIRQRVGADMNALGAPGVFPGGFTTGYLDTGAAQRENSGGGGSANYYMAVV